jgi:putative membrane protein
LLLLGYHHACGRLLKAFANNANTRSHTFYRFFNEFPAISMTLKRSMLMLSLLME